MFTSFFMRHEGVREQHLLDVILVE